MAICCGLQDSYRLEIESREWRVRVSFRQEDGDEYADALRQIGGAVERVEEEHRREQTWR